MAEIQVEILSQDMHVKEVILLKKIHAISALDLEEM